MMLCWALAATLMLTACFTGVESTKAITKKDVKRALEGTEAAVDDERGKMYVVEKASFADWQPGKLFYVTDDNVKLLFAPSASRVASTSLQQHYLSYKRYSTDTSIEGKECVVITFADESGNEYVLPTNKTLDELSQPQSPYSIPFLIDMDEVLQLRTMLSGKEVYVKSPLWYDAQGELTTGRKFVKVTINDVLPGNKVFPYKVRFADGDREAYLYMSSAQSSVQNRTYTDLFSDSDVHLRYPEISDENWACIVRGDVALGMTKDECRLSLGSPKTVDRRPTYDGLVEYWTYDNGVYLIFEDGLLRRYRK
ncbi:MAG: hypothetical protein ACI4UN_09455 [Muribaculaceae bacterium]